MRLVISKPNQILEYSLVYDATGVGPKIGEYAGVPIYESIVDGYGQHYSFVGAASRYADGTLNAEVLKLGEFILRPGLIYRLTRPRRTVA